MFSLFSSKIPPPPQNLNNIGYIWISYEKDCAQRNRTPTPGNRDPRLHREKGHTLRQQRQSRLPQRVHRKTSLPSDLQRMTCQNCAQLQEENRRLTQENTELRRRLAAYENPHTPPSRRMYPTRIHRAGARRYPGRPRGHPGSTRPRHKPDTVKTPPPKTRCEGCGASLAEPSYVGHRIVEEIMNPSPRQVIDYLSYDYECTECGSHTSARHPDCPRAGGWGRTR